jgi:hypothetical protein
MKRIFQSVGVLSLSACTTVPSTAVTTGTPTAGFGQTAIIENVRIRPIKLLEDSRCPTTVQCVWAGRIVLRVEVEAGAGADTADLPMGVPVGLGGLSLTLFSAEPAKRSLEPIPLSSYRFTFTMARDR